MNSPTRILRLDHLRKFLAVLRRDGPGEAFRRAVYYGRLLLFNQGRSGLDRPSAPRGRDFEPFWERVATEGAFRVTTPALISGRRRIAVIGDLNLPQCRKYRVEQLHDLWAKGGVDVAHAHFADFPRSADILQSASHVLFYRLALDPQTSAYLYEARRLGLPVIYDIDDPLFSVPAYATYGNAERISPHLRAHFLSQAPLYAAMMNACDAVSVSTPALRDHAACFTQRPVFVRRNFADGESLDRGRRAAGLLAHRAAAKDGAGPFTIAFASGSNGHEADFDTIAAAVATFLSARADRRLMILGRFDLAHLPEAIRARTILRPFLDYDAYLQALAGADCAIMPLADDLFNRCKSGVRLIDASAVGVAAIVSDVGDAPALIRPGETGLVVGRGQSWAAALEQMAADRAATAQMGTRARHHLETGWSARLEPPIVDPALLGWVTA